MMQHVFIDKMFTVRLQKKTRNCNAEKNDTVVTTLSPLYSTKVTQHFDPEWQQSQLTLVIGISQRKIKENITKLKAKGMIKRIGSARGGHWEIVMVNR